MRKFEVGWRQAKGQVAGIRNFDPIFEYGNCQRAARPAIVTMRDCIR